MNLEKKIQQEAEILLKMRLDGDADKIERDLKDVDKAQEGLVKTTEKNTKANQSAQKALSSLERRYDPLAKATKRLEKERRDLSRAQAEGLINAKRESDLLDRAQRSYDRYKDKIEETERAQRRLERSSTLMGRAMNAATGRVAGLTAAAGGLVGAAALTRQFFDGLNEAENIADTSLRVNADVEGLQELRIAFDRNGGSATAMDEALQRLNRRLGLFVQDGAGPAKKALEALFDETEIARLASQSTDQTFLDIADRLAAVDEPARQAAIASQLFGENSGPKLVALLAQGADGIAQYTDRARDLGLVLDEDLINGAGGANLALRELGDVVSTNITRGLISSGPEIAEFAEDLSDAIPVVLAGARAFLEFIGVLDREVTLDGVRENIAAVEETLGRAEERLRSGRSENVPLGQIRQLKEELKDLRDLEAELTPVDWDAIFDDLIPQDLQGVNGISIDVDFKPDVTPVATAAQDVARQARQAFEQEWSRADLSLDKQLARLEQEIEAVASGGIAERDLLLERFEIEDAIAKLKVEAGEAGVELSEEEIKNRRTVLKSIQDTRRELDVALQEARSTNRPGATDLPDLEIDEFGRGFLGVAYDFVAILTGGGDDFTDEVEQSLTKSGNDFARIFSLPSLGDIFLPGINGPNPANEARGGAGSFFGGQGGADPNLRSVVQIAQAFDEGGTVGGLDALADVVAQSSDIGRMAIGAGRGGLAVANLIDGNGANRTTAAVTQFFGTVGGLLGGFLSKESNNGARLTLDAASGRQFDQFKKDQGRGDQNLSDLQQFGSSASGILRELEDFLGGVRFAGDLRFEKNDRVGFKVGRPGNNHTFSTFRTFADPQEALNYAIELALQGARGGDTRRVDLFRDALDDFGAEEATNLVGRFDAFIEAGEEAQSEFQQQIGAFTDEADFLRDQFGRLGRSTADLDEVIRDRTSRIAEDTNKNAAQELLAFENQRAASVVTLIEQQQTTRDDIAAAQAAGVTNIDTTLQDQLQRAQILNLFGDLEQRFAQATDPAGARIEAYFAEQARELQAFALAVDGERITQDDLEQLQRVQAAERVSFFQSLPEDDRINVADRFIDDLRDFGAELEVVNLELAGRLDEISRSYERTLEERQEAFDRAQQFNSTASAALIAFDREYGSGIPVNRLADLRAQAVDLTDRALGGDQVAQQEVFQTISEFNRLNRDINGSGAVAASNETFSRGLLSSLRDASVEQLDDAQAALDIQSESRDYLYDIRELIAGRSLDRGALTESAAGLGDARVIDLVARLNQLDEERQGQTDVVDQLLDRLTDQFALAMPITQLPASNDQALPVGVSNPNPDLATQIGSTTINVDTSGTEEAIDGVADGVGALNQLLGQLLASMNSSRTEATNQNNLLIQAVSRSVGTRIA